MLRRRTTDSTQASLVACVEEEIELQDALIRGRSDGLLVNGVYQSSPSPNAHVNWIYVGPSRSSSTLRLVQSQY